ncbi:MAG: amidohydrolase family protein [Acidobacteriota bacterium]
MIGKKVVFGVAAISLFCLVLGRGEKAGSKRAIALCGARLITMSGPDYEDGILLIRGGRIEAVGKDVLLPEGTERIDLKSCTVLPGFIDSFTNLGTVEVSSVSQDYDEAVAPLTPQLRIIDSVNPANRFIGEARRSGITAVLCAPGDGNLLSGQSALLRLLGRTAESMVIKFPAGLHGTLGEAPKIRYGQKGIYPSTRMGEMALLRQTLLDARQYAETLERHQMTKAPAKPKKPGEKSKEPSPSEPPARDFKLEALLPVLAREIPLVLAADRMDDILSAVRLADEFGVRMIINHGAEAYKLGERLAGRNIPVLIGPLDDLGNRLEEQGYSWENALRLHQAGVLFAFQTGSCHRSTTLLDQAGSAVSHGLPPREALKALTLYPARIFGLEAEIGSLEAGKSADVIVFEGHPLERSARVRMVIIAGVVVEDMRGPASSSIEERE